MSRSDDERSWERSEQAPQPEPEPLHPDPPKRTALNKVEQGSTEKADASLLLTRRTRSQTRDYTPLLSVVELARRAPAAPISNSTAGPSPQNQEQQPTPPATPLKSGLTDAMIAGVQLDVQATAEKIREYQSDLFQAQSVEKLINSTFPNEEGGETDSHANAAIDRARDHTLDVTQQLEAAQDFHNGAEQQLGLLRELQMLRDEKAATLQAKAAALEAEPGRKPSAAEAEDTDGRARAVGSIATSSDDDQYRHDRFDGSAVNDGEVDRFARRIAAPRVQVAEPYNRFDAAAPYSRYDGYSRDLSGNTAVDVKKLLP
jgi:hypothetical protein